MADFVYNKARELWLKGDLDMDADTLRVMLVTSSYTPAATHEYVDEGGANDPVDHELSGTGYVAGHGGAGRLEVTVKSVTGGATTTFDATNDPAWAGINADCGNSTYALLIRQGTADDTDALLIACFDFAVTTNGSPVTLQWNGSGIITLANA